MNDYPSYIEVLQDAVFQLEVLARIWAGPFSVLSTCPIFGRVRQSKYGATYCVVSVDSLRCSEGPAEYC
jgi:hypothetical protein